MLPRLSKVIIINCFDVCAQRTRFSFSEKAEWRQGMDLGPLQINKNRTDRTIWAVLKDLDPNTVYWMRMKIQNKVDWSDLSDSSQSVTTGRCFENFLLTSW